MKKIIKILISSFSLIVSFIAILTLSINNSSLESLRAKATVSYSGCKCVASANDDCRSSNGNIYVGYKIVCKENW